MDKLSFIEELKSLAGLVNLPWLIAGDFNLVRWLIDHSGDYRGFQFMDLFNNFIRDAGLIEIQLQNCAFTWSNKRPNPSLSKLDRALISSDWSLQHSVITLEAQGMVVSDHVPLLLTCKGMATTQKRHKMETF